MVEQPLHWVVPGWCPSAEVVVLAGKRGTGKSSWISRLVAWITEGVPLLGGTPPQPRNALLYSAEERQQGALLGRARVAGANLAKCENGLMQLPGRSLDRPIIVGATKPLTDRMDIVRPALLVFDSIKSFLPSDMSPNDGPAVRAVVEYLQVVARRYCCLVVITLHLRKNGTGDVLDQVANSAEWTNVPRQVLAFSRDPRQDGRYILSVAKQAEGTPTAPVYYRLIERQQWGYWHCLGPAGVRLADLDHEPESAVERDQRDVARRLIRTALADGEAAAAPILMEAAKAGISTTTLWRASLDLAVKKEQRMYDGVRGHVWIPPASWPD